MITSSIESITTTIALHLRNDDYEMTITLHHVIVYYRLRLLITITPLPFGMCYGVTGYEWNGIIYWCWYW